MDKYEMVKDLGSGNFGVARLLRNKETKELVAIKYIPRGQKVPSFSSFCCISIQSPNLSPRSEAGKHPVGREPCASPQDLRLRTTARSVPHLSLAAPTSTLRAARPGACSDSLPPEHVRSFCPADDMVMDVSLSLLLVGALALPPKVDVCLDQEKDAGDISGVILVVDFAYLQRITIREIRNHPWFLKNLPRELTEAQQAQYYKRDTPTYSLQSVEEIMRIVGEARTPPPSTTPVAGFGWAEEEEEEEGKQDQQENNEEEEEEDEYDKRVKEVHASGEYPLVD
ncbi:hypothetical protein BHE74_00014164 [Ensete ventricosum]|nr:hypothetical protein BHE74_00014164 [Ensete ventricosum]